MPLAGRGMLVTSMDIDPADEQEFNRWYDREHIAERVGIEGFVEARRYIAHEAGVKYLSTYSTESFEVLDSPAYRQALGNQTEWSRKIIAKFQNMGRVIGRISASRGQGRGAALGIVRLRPSPNGKEALRAELTERLDPGPLDGIISMHLLESDPALSKSLTAPDAPNPGAGDWYVLIDGTDIEAVAGVADGTFGTPSLPGTTLVSTGIYRLMWDLAKNELDP
jgi:hypothetical protein